MRHSDIEILLRPQSSPPQKKDVKKEVDFHILAGTIHLKVLMMGKLDRFTRYKRRLKEISKEPHVVYRQCDQIKIAKCL